MSSSSPVSARCPRCSGRLLEPFEFEGRRLDICPSCQGVWCELTDWDPNRLGQMPEPARSEDLQKLGSPFLIQAERADLPNEVWTCPGCKSPLILLSVTEVENLRLDLCESCKGVWFDRGEWQDLSALHEWQSQRAAIERETNWGEWFLQLILRLPTEFNLKPRITPWVTIAILVLCVLAQILLPDDTVLAFATHGRDSLQVSQLYTLITYAFMHAGWMHLLGNMYLLYILGDNVEDVLGHFGFLAFYLACALAAGLTQVIVEPDTSIPMVGASGPIAGVIAAYLILFRRARLTFMILLWQFKPPAYVWIGIWILIQIAGAKFDADGKMGIAWYTHIGGFAAGLILIAPMRKRLVAGYPLLQLLDFRRIRA
jgi:membrane associated rhomboid family serine protease